MQFLHTEQYILIITPFSCSTLKDLGPAKCVLNLDHALHFFFFFCYSATGFESKMPVFLVFFVCIL